MSTDVGAPRWPVWCATMIVCGVALIACGRPELPAGPLLGPNDVESIEADARPGAPVSFGAVALIDSAARPLTIERIQLLRVQPGLRVLGFLAGGPDRTIFEIGYGAGFPPTTDPLATYRPAVGSTVPASTSPNGDRGLDLLIGLSADQPGDYNAADVAITYRMGDRTYQRTWRYGFTVCVAAAVRSCPPVQVPQIEKQLRLAPVG